MKGDRPQTKWQKDRKCAMKCAMKWMRSPTHSKPKIKSLAASELKIIISVTYNIYASATKKLIQVFFSSSKPSPSVHSFKLSVERPHKRRTQTEAN